MMNKLKTYVPAVGFQARYLSYFALATSFSMGLLVFRMYWTQSWEFLFLSWNLFLAGIPWLLAWGMTRLKLPVWLAFLPNAPYIITDLFHLHPRSGSPQWLDLTVIMAFAWTGLLLGLDSLRMLQRRFFDRWGRLPSLASVASLLILTSYGVYLGRYLRWNSWDLVTRPGEVLQDFWAPLITPLGHLDAWGFTLFFGLFLVLAYFVIGHFPLDRKED